MADAKRITAGLLRKYPEPRLALHYSSPLQLLVATILSAQCTDARVNEVTRVLFKKYKTARDYAEVDAAAFEQQIRSTGFYKSKAKRVIACCRALVERFDGRVPRTLDEMLGLPGVGRKTANMVLGNACGVPGIAVDTHVLRVSNRLGLVRSDDAERVEQALCEQVDEAKWVAFSNAMVLHGRETCTARKPCCGACVLYQLCEWPDKQRYAQSP